MNDCFLAWTQKVAQAELTAADKATRFKGKRDRLNAKKRSYRVRFESFKKKYGDHEDFDLKSDSSSLTDSNLD